MLRNVARPVAGARFASRVSRPTPPLLGLVLLGLVLLGLAGTTGCGGCGPQNAASKATGAKKASGGRDQQGKNAQDRKEEFDIRPLTPLLSESIVDADGGAALRLAKSGHWTDAVQRVRSNHRDVEGRTTQTVVDAKGRPTPLGHTRFAMTSGRPAVLAKGRPKRVESELFIPPDATRVRVASELTEAGGGTVYSESRPWRVMPSHQYFLVVLAKEPSRYAFLKVTDAVRAPGEDQDGSNSPHYRVVLADAARPLPLPANVLAWTSVAYVVWDEVNPDRLDPAQQQALVDWLCWGGRLIVNGPTSLATLRGSFLAKYLPADAGATRSFGVGDLQGLIAAWSKRRAGKPAPPLTLKQPLSGIDLQPRPAARALPGADGLFYEASVGAGSIVVSAIQLADRQFVNWQGFDGVLNGVLLRRPSRQFRVTRGDMFASLQMAWADFPNRARDAHFTTPLRWFSRDAGARANVREATDLSPSQTGAPNLSVYGQPLPETRQIVEQPGGLGQWNEFGVASQAARESLVEAAGVRVLGAGFVVACLALYLLVLVPLNWAVFHTLGRVEWAWIAAPIIALAGTLVVVRQAQLDIGFVRAQTEIALLELYGDHPRGRLTRYTGFYSSLSTIYDLQFADPSAVATPFPRSADFTLPTGESPTVLALEKYDKPRLRGFPVSSASTQFVHSEQMYGLPGPLRLSSPSTSATLLQLENQTGLDLADAVVVRRRFDSAGRPDHAASWLGQVARGSSALLHWTPIELSRTELPFAAERKQAAAGDPRKRLDVDKLLALAFRFPPDSDPLQGRRDEFRLVARIDDSLPGMTAAPEASQSIGSTVVLARLRLGPPPPPTPDANNFADAQAELDRRNANSRGP